MAKHEIVIHENTGATKASAPNLGSYISKETLKLESYQDAIAAKCGLPAIQVAAIITGSFEAWEALEKESLVRIHTDLGSILGIITGSFATSDAAFDPEKNALELALRLEEDIKLSLADETPVISTDGLSTKLRLDNVVDVASPKPYNIIHGTNVFRLQGFNMVLSDEGAEAYFEDEHGVKFPLTIDEVVSKQLILAYVTGISEGCDGKIVIKSRAGDAEGPLQTSFRKVKFLYVEPVPTVTCLTTDVDGTTDKVSASASKLYIKGCNLTGASDFTVEEYNSTEEKWDYTTPNFNVDTEASGAKVIVFNTDSGAVKVTPDGTKIRASFKIDGTTYSTNEVTFEA